MRVVVSWASEIRRPAAADISKGISIVGGGSTSATTVGTRSGSSDYCSGWDYCSGFTRKQSGAGATDSPMGLHAGFRVNASKGCHVHSSDPVCGSAKFQYMVREGGGG
jgi:hypothetical protein